VCVDTHLIKTLISEAAMSLADVLMSMIEEDCRRVLRLVTSRYTALLAKAKEQPKVRQPLYWCWHVHVHTLSSAAV
jgi:hypothetical protein